MTFQDNLPDRSDDNQGNNQRADLSIFLLNAYLLFSGIIIAGAILGATYLGRMLAEAPIEQREIIIRNLPVFLVFGVILTLILCLIFGWFVLRRLILPIEKLVDFSEAIRWRGHLHPDELQLLSKLSKQPAQVGALARTLKAMEQETTRRISELTTLLETSRTVAASLNIDEVIDRLLGQIQTLTGVERCAVLTFDERRGMFRMIASRGMGDYAERYNAAPAHDSLPSLRALRKNKLVQVSDTETDLSYAEMRQRSRAEGFRSILAIPIISNNAKPAVLMLYKNQPYYYGYQELELIVSFANQASVAMENAALYELVDQRLQEQTKRLEAIVESMRDGLILESLNGRILYCNQQAATLLGQPIEAIQGQESHEILQPTLKTATPVADNLLEIDQFENGLELRIHLFDVTDVRGNLLGRGQLWQDISHDNELDRMKSALISTVSHELRTPLATIKGYATTLLANDVEWDSDSQKEFLSTISNETDRLAKLVKNLLDMSRIEGRTLNILKEPRDLNEVVLETIHQYEPHLQKRILLHLEDTPQIQIDSQRINTVIRNLVENAFKYSNQDSTIEIYTMACHHHVKLAVRDYGVGIAQEHHRQIFEQFFRIDNGLARKVGGVGIGLAICKGFIEAHNGQIWVERLEDGSMFWFKLPVG